MTAAKHIEHVDDVEVILDPVAAREVFDQQVSALLPGVSGEEFIRRWEAGEFDEIADQPGHRHIMRLALMIPCDDNRA